jgi:heme/copper-type cytochrome/quinol oxidase subunit 2
MDFNPVQTATEPISGLLNLFMLIIIIVLIIIFFSMMMIGRAVGVFTDAKPPPKENFKDGPPYPHCKTNGALGLF